MKEGIVDLSAKTKEEPWCSHCSGFTDYKRKWTAYQRADLNGGIYPENDDVPHCVSCGSMMHFLSSSRLLVWGCRFIGSTIFVLITLVCFFLFDYSLGVTTLWGTGIVAAILLSKLPIKSRKALTSYDLYVEKQKLSNLEKKL